MLICVKYTSLVCLFVCLFVISILFNPSRRWDFGPHGIVQSLYTFKPSLSMSCQITTYLSHRDRSSAQRTCIIIIIIITCIITTTTTVFQGPPTSPIRRAICHPTAAAHSEMVRRSISSTCTL